jgi:hypothetical protein
MLKNKILLRNKKILLALNYYLKLSKIHIKKYSEKSLFTSNLKKNNVSRKRLQNFRKSNYLKFLGLIILTGAKIKSVNKKISHKDRILYDQILTIFLYCLKTYYVILYAKLFLDYYPQFNPYLQPFRTINFLTEGPIRLMGVVVPMRVRPIFDYRFTLLVMLINTLIIRIKKYRDFIRAGGSLRLGYHLLF